MLCATERFEVLAPIESHVNENEKKNPEKSKFQKFKTLLLSGPLIRKFRKSLKGFKSDLRE